MHLGEKVRKKKKRELPCGNFGRMNSPTLCLVLVRIISSVLLLTLGRLLDLICIYIIFFSSLAMSSPFGVPPHSAMERERERNKQIDKGSCSMSLFLFFFHGPFSELSKSIYKKREKQINTIHDMI